MDRIIEPLGQRAVWKNKEMNIFSLWFQEKWLNRIRQFGLPAALKQIIQAIIRPVWQIKRNLLMAIPRHSPDALPNHTEITSMTPLKVTNAFEHSQVTEQQKAILLNFLDDGCEGFLAMIKNHLAGYIFIQLTGTYKFAGSGRLVIPEYMMILKNLFVFPQFRGHSLGKKLNQVSIASIPKDQTPIVLVIPENRFAIRNLKMYGFEEMLLIRRITWFKKWTSQRISIINDCKITHLLIRGLEGNSTTI